jgi:protein-tyrosine-phosphatase
MADTARSKLFQSILVLCTHNAVRSPICAVLLREKLGDKAFVASAGVKVEEGAGPDRFTTELMKEAGYDISNRIPVAYSDMEDQAFDLIIALSPAALELAREIAERQPVDIEYWDLPEPPGILSGLSEVQMLEAYRRLRENIRDQISKRFG